MPAPLVILLFVILICVISAMAGVIIAPHIAAAIRRAFEQLDDRQW